MHVYGSIFKKKTHGKWQIFLPPYLERICDMIWTNKLCWSTEFYLIFESGVRWKPWPRRFSLSWGPLLGGCGSHMRIIDWLDDRVTTWKIQLTWKIQHIWKTQHGRSNMKDPSAFSCSNQSWGRLLFVVEMAGARPKLDVSDLAMQLERQEAIREHLRGDAKAVLFPETTNICVKHACHPQIHALLKILLIKTVETPNKPQPPIHPLREQLALLYAKMSRPGDDKTVIEDSWFIRIFLGLVKMKTRKEKVSTAASLKMTWTSCMHVDNFHASPPSWLHRRCV